MSEIVFLGNSLKVMKKYPPKILDEILMDLNLINNGLQPQDFKPINSVGKGVYELRTRGNGRTFRTFYVTKIKDETVVLHSFEKKTQKTPQKEIELAKKRLNAYT